MSEIDDDSDGSAIDLGTPIERSGGDTFVNPDDIGFNKSHVGSSSGDSGSGGNRNSGNYTGTDFGDGYGPDGKYGKGRFPDGRSRKRASKGDGTNTGTAQARTKTRSVNSDGYEVLLISIHAGLSAILERGIPDDERIVRLGDSDSKRLAVATANVARHYPAMKTTAKVMDHINLIGVAASIYGPMLMVLKMRAQERAEERAHNATNVTPMPQRMGNTFGL